MALSLSRTLPTGVEITYWCISNVNLNMASQTASILMDGYLDANSKPTGKTPVTSVLISIDVHMTTPLPSISMLDALYAKVCLDPFFSGSIPIADGI